MKKPEHAKKIQRPPIQKLKRLSKQYHDIGASPASTILTPEQEAIYNGRGRLELAWAMYDTILYVEQLEKIAALADYMAAHWKGINADEGGICNFCSADAYADDDCDHDPNCVVILLRRFRKEISRR